MFNFLRKKLSEWKENLKKVETSAPEKEAKKSVSEKPKGIAAEETIKEKSKPKKKIELKEEVLQEEQQEKQGFFSKLKESITTIEITQKEIEKVFENLEEILLESNVAVEVVDKLKNDLRHRLLGKRLSKKEYEKVIEQTLRQSIYETLKAPDNIIYKIKEKKDAPFVLVFFGINGVGKTTTIAKFAHFLQKNSISCVLAAGDTFRAASIEQLEKHSEQLHLPIIKQPYGADPAAVGFDAIQYAKSHHKQCVLIDTAGRMHTKRNLIKEMEKIIHVTKPDMKIFVAESITGNDAIEQAREFKNTVGIDGTILTKADVDEKGGTILSISYITEKPILFLGTGQLYKDLEIFDKEKVLKRLGL